MSERVLKENKVVVFGASGHAKVVLDILRLLGGFVVAGLLDDYKPLGTKCLGAEVIGSMRELPVLSAKLDNPSVLVAVGDNWRRARIVEQIRSVSPDTRFLTAIHPSAQIGAEATIEAGTVIMAGAVVNAGARIGPFCIVNTRASLDHDSVMNEFSSLAPGSTTGGNVKIGAYTNVGIGAIVLPEVSIGEHTVIGAGSLVTRSIPDHVVAYGAPARYIRARQNGDRYLGDPGASSLRRENRIG